MIRSLGGRSPRIADTAWVSEFAYVIGDVEIGEHSSVWPGVTIRGDGDGPVVLGNYVNVQEGSVVHGSHMMIEDYVTIGHCVVVHCQRIGSGSLMGNNSTILNGSTLGKRCLVAANSVVLANREIPPDSFITGVPGSIKRPVNQAQIERMMRTARSLAEKAKLFKESGV